MTSISKNYKARIQISFNTSVDKSTLIAKSIHCALNPEIRQSCDSEVVTRVSISVTDLLIEVESDDVPKFRATINSYLRLANAAYNCIVN